MSVPTPSSIHVGGELGSVLAHAFDAAFDYPDIIVAAVVGDGAAETARRLLEEHRLPQPGARRRDAPNLQEWVWTAPCGDASSPLT